MYYSENKILASENTVIYTLILRQSLRFQVAKGEFPHKLGMKMGLSACKAGLIRKQITSIPSVGIEVGEFRTLDRKLHPNFCQPYSA